MKIGDSTSSLTQMLQMMQQQVQQNFTTADADGDGALTASEFANFDTAMRTGTPSGGQGSGPTAQEMFAKMDADGNGSVTLAEMQSAMPMANDTLAALLQDAEQTQGVAHKGGMMQHLQDAFTSADADGDGALSEAEFSAFDAEMKADAPSGAAGTDASSLFSQLDSDGDGKVTMDELKAAAPPPPPVASDEDDDDTLTADAANAISGIIQKLLDAYKQNDNVASLLATAAVTA